MTYIKSFFLFSAMMMTACDVAAITKPWAVQRRVSRIEGSYIFLSGDIPSYSSKISYSFANDCTKYFSPSTTIQFGQIIHSMNMFLHGVLQKEPLTNYSCMLFNLAVFSNDFVEIK